MLATAGRKPSPSTCSISAAQQRGLDGAADQAGAFAEDRDGLLLGLGVRIEQLFLGDAAVGPQRLVLAAVDARAFSASRCGHHAGQREIDVVAAQQDVLADGDAVRAPVRRSAR